MSIRQKVGSVTSKLNPRSHSNHPTSLEAEREAAIQNFCLTLQKSCHKNDEAPKEKHIRATIVQTHEAHSAVLFWKLAAKLPLAVNAITCWKFSYLVHKLLRDGYKTVAKDSKPYIPKLNELGRYWSHIQGYGPLIDHYMKLLHTSIDFRLKYPFLPGSLKSDGINLEREIGAQVDAKFDFVLDILDMLEVQLLFARQIFRTFERSGSAASPSGQNRLTPCIPIILDTQELYTMCVKYLDILHQELPSEPLAGFRERFIELYRQLKHFYQGCLGVHFLRHVTSIPQMPDTQPNFESTVPEANQAHTALQPANQPDPEPELPEPEIASLIDISNGLDSLDVGEFHQHSQVEQLQMEVAQLRMELEESQQEKQLEVTKLLEHISKMEHEKEQLQHHQLTAVNTTKLEQAAAETKATQLEGAYRQLKEKHLALVNNHANLIRSTASEADKIDAKLASYSSDQLNCAIQHTVGLIQSKREHIGAESIEQRTASILQLEAPLAQRVPLLGAQLADLAGEAAQLDGNMITPALDLLNLTEGAFNQLLINRDQLDLSQVESSLDKLKNELIRLKNDTIEITTAPETELNCAHQMIEQAAARIRDMLNAARTEMSGVELQVHENILDKCTELMNAILALIKQSDQLQREIVEAGRGAGSAADFYNRNSRWTEGLLSAAKAVGLRAQTLTDSADRAIKEKAGFDAIIVASREISASTAQLVAASRVKANSGESLSNLERLSRQVNRAAGEVVGASQSGQERHEQEIEIDFGAMSYTQAKKLEMDTQEDNETCKILQLEAALNRERGKVRQIRKSAYTDSNVTNPMATKILTDPKGAQASNLAELTNVLASMESAPAPPVTTPTPTPRKSISQGRNGL